MATAEADWSQLPKDLLHLISQRMDNEIDLIRFRSICSNWRSSSIPNHHCNILTLEYPLLRYPFEIDSLNNNTSFSYLSKHSFFLIKPPPQQTLVHRPWLIRITQNSSGKTQLLHPYLPPKPFPFNPVVNFNRFSLLHLVTNFIIPDNKEPLHNTYMYPEKVVAVTCHDKKPIILGTLSFSRTSKPVLLKCGDENWKAIPDMSPCSGDICLFNGSPYLVDKTGRTVTVRPDDSTVQLVAEPLVDGGGNRKFLVESEGELLLTDFYESLELDGDDLANINFLVRIHVFKLNEKEKKWVKLANLGDRVLFLGSLCSFSASASDLCVAKGNCVIIMDNISTLCGSCFLDLDDGQLSLLSKYPEYSKLLWPPPEWIAKRS